MTNKHLALFDLDKTIYKNHSFFELAKYEVDRGRVSQETWKDIQKLLELYETGKNLTLKLRINYSKRIPIL